MTTWLFVVRCRQKNLHKIYRHHDKRRPTKSTWFTTGTRYTGVINKEIVDEINTKSSARDLE